MLILLLFIPLFISSCATYKKETKAKSAAELYKEGLSHMSRRNYHKAIATFYQLKYDYPEDTASMLADLKIADAYYADKNYEEAISSYEEFRKLHPSSPYIPYVIYMIGLSHYKMILSIDRDQTHTQRALSEFSYLLTHYPNTPYAWDAYQKLRECQKRLSAHEAYVGHFYYKQKKYKAAIKRFETALKRYPTTPLEDKILYILADCYRKVGDPEKARRVYEAILKQYPRSNYAKKARTKLKENVGENAEEKKGGTQQASLQERPSNPSRLTVEPPSQEEKSRMERAPEGVLSREERPTSGIAKASESQGIPFEETTGSSEPERGSQKDIQKLRETKYKGESSISKDPTVSSETERSSTGLREEDELQVYPHSKEPISLIPQPNTMEGEEPQESKALTLVEKEEGEEVSGDESLTVEEGRSEWESFLEDEEEEKKVVIAEEARKEEDKEVKAEKDVEAKRLGFTSLSTDKPINISADRMDAFQRENRVVFRGKVVVHQEDTHIYAEKLTADLSRDDEGGSIKRITALKSVRISQGDRVATCEKAEFDIESKIIILSGEPKLWQGQDRISGSRVTVDLNEERMTVEGEPGRRVSVVLYPKRKGGEKREVKRGKLLALVPEVKDEEKPLKEEENDLPPTQGWEEVEERDATLAHTLISSSLDAAHVESVPPLSGAPLKEEGSPEPTGERVILPSLEGGSSVDTEKEILDLIYRWRSAWQSKDLETYISFYSQRFHSNGKNRSAWRKYKARLNRKYTTIRVDLEDIKVSTEGDRVLVSFIQRYTSDGYSDVGRKTLVLIRENGGWRILEEHWRPL